MPATRQLLGKSWIGAAVTQRRFKRRLRRIPSREQLIQQYAPGRSFVDVGAMWGVHAKLAFLAEESGATSVTAVDMMSETDEYKAEHARRGSRVRFVQGDLHDPAVLEEIGEHDVVFCAGVLYHAPNPIHTLQCLRKLTKETLILMTAAIPEIPGVEQGCVFYPGLSAESRAIYQPASPGPRLGITTPFIPEGSEEEELGAGQSGTYDNWWWGFSPSAVKGMLSVTGFEVSEIGGEPFAARLVARAVG